MNLISVISHCSFILILFPAANLPDSSIAPYNDILATGVHYGYAKILTNSDSGASTSKSLPMSEEHGEVYPMVMSIGWNPFYKNKTRTAVSSILTSRDHLSPSFNNLEIIYFEFMHESCELKGLQVLANIGSYSL